MEKKHNPNREKILLNQGIGLIENYDCRFVAYNTKFLGYSYDGYYVINGKHTKNSKSLNEFCYGYDGKHHELQLLHVYLIDDKIKYATTEVLMGIYAFWNIIEP